MVEFVLNGCALLMTVRFGDGGLVLQGKADATLLEYFVHRSDGIEHFGETDERCCQIHRFP